jgi:hypothetical protein
MVDLRKQRICIKFYLNLENTASEAYTVLQKTFHDDTTGRIQTFGWYSSFTRDKHLVEGSET